MADCEIKRVCGGYIITERWKNFLGCDGDAITTKVIPVGQESKVLEELFGYIFENELDYYGNCCRLTLDVETVTFGEDNKNDSYINAEMFRDEMGYDFSNLKKPQDYHGTE